MISTILKLILLCIILNLPNICISQTSTEIYLFDLLIANKTIVIDNPVNISQNPGAYDNQPSFLSSSQAVLFSSQRNNQTDVCQYDIETQTHQFLTDSEGSEYSPTPLPNSPYFSTIILEKDGRQLLWKYPITGGSSSILVPDLKIGYHCWYDENTVFSFVLGEVFTLQKSILGTSNEIIANNIGRSLHKLPHKDAISYIDKSSETWSIVIYQPKNGRKNILTNTIAGVEDMTWLANGWILMGKDSEVFLHRGKKKDTWSSVADLQEYNLSGITRVAASPNMEKLAIVVGE
ncbi:MAG: hypothetical protein KI790_09135 [Cyclobacteriaceae bacterium]|nr:hypothetical protein [Cyclobacteriaceae bacterium HetDA_MAG_MS6]